MKEAFNLLQTYEIFLKLIYLKLLQEYLNNEIIGFTDKTGEEESVYYTVTDIQSSEDGSAFISEDPARDGSNWYGYAGCNPMVYTDPTGSAPYINGIYDGDYNPDYTPEAPEMGPQTQAQKKYYDPQECIILSFNGVAPPVVFNWEDSSHVTSPWSQNRPEMDTKDARKTKKGHNGMDFDGKIGDRINAIMDGKIEEIGYDKGYGNYIILRHKDGTKSLGYDGDKDGRFRSNTSLDNPARLLYSEGY
mgnify:CR=1 FL=1